MASGAAEVRGRSRRIVSFSLWSGPGRGAMDVPAWRRELSAEKKREALTRAYGVYARPYTSASPGTRRRKRSGARAKRAARSDMPFTDRRWYAALLALASCVGCGTSEPRLFVDLVTDYGPGEEFVRVEAEVTGGVPSPQTTTANRGDDFVSGARVGEWMVAERGWHRATVRLIRSDGSLLAETDREIEVRGLRATRLVITRDCADLQCPGRGDSADATECVDARCVPPTCPVGVDVCSGRSCSSDSECPSPSASCARAVCSAGACLTPGESSRCAADEYSDPDRGCLPHPGADDAGIRVPSDSGAAPMDAGSAECTTDADCADAVACTSDRCAAGRCTHVPDDSVCTARGQTCSSSAGCQATCSPATCTGGPCQDASCQGGRCVVTDLCASGESCCDGSCQTGSCSGPCAGHSAGYVCRTSSDLCDLADTCDGSSTTCINRVRSAGTVCRAASGECDVADSCDGTHRSCPQGYRPLGHPCTGGSCNGHGTCVVGCTQGASCSTGNSCERGTTDCSGSTTTCISAGPAPAGTTCRAATGDCDLPATCDGSSTTCPAGNPFRSSSYVCRASTGPCDLPDTCTGSSATCPDQHAANGTTCIRPGACYGSTCSDGTCTGGVSCLPPNTFCNCHESCGYIARVCM